MVTGVRQMADIGVVHPSLLVWGESERHAMQQKVRSRQETVNKQLKNWAILVTPYHHNLKLRQAVFAAFIALLQLSFEYNPLFSVEYNDYFRLELLLW
jgi:hypothetical protein